MVGRFRGRHQGFHLAIHFWVCVNCRKSFEEKKPGYCDKCEQRNFWHMDSKAEFLRFRELELMEKARVISNLKVHPQFDFTMLDKLGNPFRAGYYEADFQYTENGQTIVEDVKPLDPRAQTEVFKLKKRWFEKVYKIPLTIIKRG